MAAGGEATRAFEGIFYNRAFTAVTSIAGQMAASHLQPIKSLNTD